MVSELLAPCHHAVVCSLNNLEDVSSDSTAASSPRTEDEAKCHVMSSLLWCWPANFLSIMWHASNLHRSSMPCTVLFQIAFTYSFITQRSHTQKILPNFRWLIIQNWMGDRCFKSKKWELHYLIISMSWFHVALSHLEELTFGCNDLHWAALRWGLLYSPPHCPRICAQF